MPACPRSTWLPIDLYPKRDHSCPAITIKTTIPAAGVIGPSASRFADRKFRDKKFSRGAPDRGPRKEFGPDRGESRPWQKRDAGSPDHVGRNSRPSRDGAGKFEKRSFDKPKFDKPRYDKP